MTSHIALSSQCSYWLACLAYFIHHTTFDMGFQVLLSLFIFFILGYIDSVIHI